MNSQNGFVIGGASDEDGFGTSVSGAGDVNGDGFDDVIIGAPFEDTNGNQGRRKLRGVWPCQWLYNNNHVL